MLVGHSISDANGLLLTMDPAVEALLHRSQVELVGKSYAEITHPDDRQRNGAQLARLAPGAGPIRIRKRYLRPDGMAIWADLHVSRLGQGLDMGRLVGTLYLPDPESIAFGPESLWKTALKVDAMMRRRREELGDDLFGDKAWMILLQTYLAEAEGRAIEISALSDLARISVAQTTRWVSALAQKALVEVPDWNEKAIQLTALGLDRVESLLAGYETH